MQYADIALTRRIGRQHRFLTYVIPPALLPLMIRGTVVEAPFRQTISLGVVADLRRTLPSGVTASRLRPIKRVLSLGPLYGPHEILLRQELAAASGQPASLFFTLGLPPHAILKAVTLREEQLRIQPARRDAFLEGPGDYPDRLRERLKRIRAARETALILVPTSQLREYWFEWLINQSFGTETVIFDPHGPVNTLKSIWQIVSGEKPGLVLANRAGVFLPFRRLDAIIIDQPSHHQFIEEQAPYYDTFQVARHRAEQFGSDLLIREPLPPLAILTRSIRRHWLLLASERPAPQICIVQHITSHALAPASGAAIQTALDQKQTILVIIPRSGWAAGLICSDCQAITSCSRCQSQLVITHEEGPLWCSRCRSGTPIPTACSICHGTNLRPFGWGKERWQATFAKQFASPLLTVETPTFFRLDSTTADIVLLLAPERLVSGTDYRTSEAWLRFLWDAKSRAQSALIIETQLTGHPVLHELTEPFPKTSLANELRARKDYGYPPYQPILTIIFPRRLSDTQPTVIEKYLQTLRARSGFQVNDPLPIMTHQTISRPAWQVVIKLPTSRQSDKLRKIQTLLPATARFQIER